MVNENDNVNHNHCGNVADDRRRRFALHLERFENDIEVSNHIFPPATQADAVLHQAKVLSALRDLRDFWGNTCAVHYDTHDLNRRER